MVDGLWAGGESSLEGSEREANRSLARTGQLVGLAHFRFHVIRYGLVQANFDVGKLVVYRVGFAFWEQWCIVELDQLFLDHTSHQVRAINLVSGITPELAVEPVGIEEGKK